MATYYVRKTGNDANAGTSAGAAKLTIQAAVNLATTAGDTVYVGAGSYRETVTLAASGSSGSPISIIGDYAGTQTGDAGVVRITGSNDDATVSRTTCITGTSRSWVNISSLTLDMFSQNAVRLSSCTDVILAKLYCSTQTTEASEGCVHSLGASQARITVSNCFVFAPASDTGRGINFTHSGTVDNCAHVVSSCIVVGGAGGIVSARVGGITVRNCAVLGARNTGYWIEANLTAGQTMTVNNSIASSTRTAFGSSAATFLVEDYCCISQANAARSNVTAGANSNTRPLVLDSRWFHSLTGGGSLVSPFDLASYSGLVELNSGTGAPSTDMRGASQTGTYREWGPLEYNAALSVSGGAALGLPIVGSAIVRGDG